MVNLNTSAVRRYLKEGNFRDLFIEELGWDRHSARLVVPVDGKEWTLHATAQKRGLVVYLCPTSAGERLPEYPIRRKIEQQVAKSVREHIIVFTDAGPTTQIWQWVKREPGKPAACREHHFHATQPGTSLIQKLQSIAFALEEEESLTLTDVTRRTRGGFDVERVTKRFYDQFRKEHATFLQFISGITDTGDHEWYASVMLNRLMFVYFIQRKGFLDGDMDYLRNRLNRCERERGKDRFYSFYRHFLLRLFHEGLGGKTRTAELDELLGRVPYLNGGLFEPHEVEARYPEITIPDEAFERVFDYFDQYQWHLDERPLRADNEINPDVLGYIFEKYINQKQMGAYYTKEDITEYISKNTVIPFLVDTARKECKVAFENPGGPTVWDLLRDDPDRYIYPAVRHGVDLPLPDEIAAGVNPPTLHEPVGDGPVQTLELRKGWNRAAPTEYALPTEIWRQVVARRQRCEEVRAKLRAGEIRDVNDLITLNLDIRQFAQDAVENCGGPDLLRAFWHVIKKITILDPACGSGAFLFAALNILEPLYEACLDRMEAFVEDLERSGEKHSPEKFSDFRRTLDHVAAHPNRAYFILKSIILNNLYGVDIMEEAVEICKLRLFLKLAAQVEPDPNRENFGIEPLPDIDFNIRAGNTLVGFATYADVQKALTYKMDFHNALEKISVKAADLQQAFDAFRERQVEDDGSVPTEHKIELRKRLTGLQDELNRYLAGEYGVEPTKKEAYAQWLKSHQPFHWFVEFYGIMNGGGFDVIIGNPPYVEVPKDLSRSLLRATFKSALEKWSRDEDLYTLVVERSLCLLRARSGQFGMILPLSLAFSTKRPFVALRKVMMGEEGLCCFSHFDRIPSALFGNEVRTRCTVSLLARNSQVARFVPATTSLLRWSAEFRDHLFQTICYASLDLDIAVGIPKVATQVQADALGQMLKAKAPLVADLSRSIPFDDLAQAAPNFPQPCVYVGGTAYNWFPAWRDIPETTTMDGEPSLPARTAGFMFANEESANIVFALLCSAMGYWWWAVASDGFNLKKWLLERFPVSVAMISSEARKQLAQLGGALRRELGRNYVHKDNKGRIGNFFLPACEQEVVAIDSFLATAVPGLSQEFFEDIRTFNACFSRAEASDDGSEGEKRVARPAAGLGPAPLPKGENHFADLMRRVGSMNLSIVDQRSKGGALWVIGGRDLGDLLSPHGFKFAPNGSRATKRRPAWYIPAIQST
jgi:hypothetical protein